MLPPSFRSWQSLDSTEAGLDRSSADSTEDRVLPPAEPPFRPDAGVYS